MPRLYDYRDYRKFIEHAVEERKKQNPQYSFRSFARALDINSSTLLRIVSGERNLSKKLMPIFIKALKLKAKETEYFELLVKIDQEKDISIKAIYLDHINKFCAVNVRNVQPGNYGFYEKWYYSVIRELVDLTPIKESDAARVGALLTPPISPKQVKQAFKVLIKLGFIEPNPDGVFKQKGHYISTGDAWSSLSIQEFQKTMANFGVRALTSFPKKERDISTVTLTLSQEGQQQLQNILADTRRKIMDLAKGDSSEDRVCQVNLQLFPLSKTLPGVKK